MDKTNYNKKSPEVKQLINAIELKANMKVRTPSDFTYLAGLISGKTGEMLSPTTLKRLWGYIEGADVTRQSTLNILSKYIGFSQWTDFLKSFEKEGQSFELTQGSILAEDLKDSDLVEIKWLPNRRIVVKYLNNFKFEVVEAINSKVSVGDTFYCRFFILNEPLYVDNFIHNNSMPVAFIMGAKDGLTSITKLS